MYNDCHCTRMLAMIEATLARIPAVPPDPDKLGASGADVVWNILRQWYDRTEMQHRRHTSDDKPAYV